MKQLDLCANRQLQQGSQAADASPKTFLGRQDILLLA